jgi:hypothetical protein
VVVDDDALFVRERATGDGEVLDQIVVEEGDHLASADPGAGADVANALLLLRR